MGRLKRSCVVGSVVFHILILAMLVLGPMLLAKRDETVRVIDLVSSDVIDKLLAPAAPVAPPPAPAPPKPTPPKPEPKKIQPKPKPKPILPKPKIITPKPKPKPKPKIITPKPKPKIKVNLNSNVRKPDARNTKAQKEAAKQREALNRSLNKLDTKLSDRTAVNVPLGRYASANYESLIRRKYMDATIHPGAISGDPVVKVRLVIARNGRVISARVTSQAGLASWDRAVQKALDRVKFIKPFPESMKGSQQTFNLNFNSRSFL